MPTIWDLMPAGFWPTQPFIPTPDPTQSPARQQAAPPSWIPSTPSLPTFGGPITPSAPADVSPDPGASVSPWDGAVRQALAAQAGLISRCGPSEDFRLPWQVSEPASIRTSAGRRRTQTGCGEIWVSSPNIR